MCATSELTVMVADSKQGSLSAMCHALSKVGFEHLMCVQNSRQGLQLSTESANKHKAISILFCNGNLISSTSEEFITFIKKQHPGIIIITYSNCILPEAHIRSLFDNGSYDHIEQDKDFEEKVSFVSNRWLRAAKLQFDYGKRYGQRHA